MVGRILAHAPLDIDSEVGRHTALIVHLVAIAIDPLRTRTGIIAIPVTGTSQIISVETV